MLQSPKTIPWPEDSTRVDVSREDEVLFWCKRFSVNPAMLRQAVRFAGSEFKDVAAFLKARSRPQ